MALFQSLEFFTHKTESRLIFLAQIDFWDFEIDSLIYCFNSFNERKEMWDNSINIEEMLLKKNFIPKKRILNDFVRDKKYQKRIERWNRAKTQLKGDVESPDKSLLKCINKWNELISECQNLLVNRDTLKKAVELCNAKIECDLDKYKKASANINQ